LVGNTEFESSDEKIWVEREEKTKKGEKNKENHNSRWSQEARLVRFNRGIME
jgi:hypothetical protein